MFRPSRPMPYRRRLVSAVGAPGLVAALVLLAAFVTATPADAYTGSTSGSPGGASFKIVQGLHYDACAGLSYRCYNPEIFIPAPDVTRSPGSNGPQVILIANRVYRWNGSSYVDFTGQVGSKVLPAGQSQTALPYSDVRINQAGYYRVQTTVFWYAQSGSLLGSRIATYNQSGEYGCVGRFTAACQAGVGYIYLRSPGT